MAYTSEMYFDMLMCLGASNENVRQAAALYRERFPERNNFPDYKLIRRLADRVKNGNSVMPKKGNFQRRPLPIELENLVLDAFRADVNLSLRNCASRLGTSDSTVFKILKKHNFHPYRYQKVHCIVEDRDPQSRLNFVVGFLAQQRQNNDFYRHILWTDECTFTPNGCFNSKNFVYWSVVNPRAVKPTRHQHMWSINYWAGLIDDQLVIFFSNNLFC